MFVVVSIFTLPISLGLWTITAYIEGGIVAKNIFGESFLGRGATKEFQPAFAEGYGGANFPPKHAIIRRKKKKTKSKRKKK